MHNLVGVVSGDTLEEAVDDALCRRLCRVEDLPARGALREVLAAWNGNGVAEGVAEMPVVRALPARGLPAPVRQYEIRAAPEDVDDLVAGAAAIVQRAA